MSAFIGIPILMLIILISGLACGGEDTSSIPGPRVQYDEYGVCSINGGYTTVDCATGVPNGKDNS